MARFYIGIDPGTNTGLAIWNSSRRQFERVGTFGIVTAMVEIVEFVRYHGIDRDDVEIVFEDARKRKWIPREKSLSQFKGRAMGAGSVKRDCSIWEEFCKYYGFRLSAAPPRAGMTKWEPEYWAKMTGWKGRTSNHARDAALLVFNR